MKTKPRLNVERLIKDCGDVRTVAAVTGIQRTGVYSIIRRGRMNTDQLAEILKVFRHINIRDYMEE